MKRLFVVVLPIYRERQHNRRASMGFLSFSICTVIKKELYSTGKIVGNGKQ